MGEADPPWLAEALRLKGLQEQKGEASNPVLLWMARKLGLLNFVDADPWCSLFAAHCLRITLPDEPMPRHLLWSRAFAKWGVPLAKPVRGALLVNWRGKRIEDDLGHCSFLLEDTDFGHFKTIGGNVGDRVDVSLVRKDRIVPNGIRWPHTYPPPAEKE
ncbi:MAG TPA: hypothetical protein VGU45_05040 [Microvirga sp.]|jgi:uncharacterized protein (TIGR02594 family)|nr:hypothetical protein [Microvirga sp.]